MNGRPANLKHDAKQFNPTLMTDDEFIAFGHLVDCLDSVVDKFSKFGAGCTCHGHVLAGRSEWQQQQLLQFHFAKSRCPLAGKRAPELAANKMDEVVKQVFEQTLQ